MRILDFRFGSSMLKMTKKILPILFFALLALAAIWLKNRNGLNNDDKERKKPKTDKPTVNRDRGFDRRISYLEYTRHAKCRMECRHVTQKEVEDIVRNGEINYRKSDVNDVPCPTYALEGYTDDKQHVRIVFAQCDNKTKVVTCIDLDNEFACDCQ